MPRKRVLIADDSEIMRKTIASFMEREPDIEVCALTATGMDTLNTALALRPDLLILDLQMPVLNGVEIAGVLHKACRKRKPFYSRSTKTH